MSCVVVLSSVPSVLSFVPSVVSFVPPVVSFVPSVSAVVVLLKWYAKNRLNGYSTLSIISIGLNQL